MVVYRGVHTLVALAVLLTHQTRAQDVALNPARQAVAKGEHSKQAGPVAIPGPLHVPHPFAGPLPAPMPNLIPEPVEGPHPGPIPSPLENPIPAPIGPIPPPEPAPMPVPALPPHPVGPIPAPVPILMPVPALPPHPVGPVPAPVPIPMSMAALPECSMFEHTSHQDGGAAAFHHVRSITQEECCSMCHHLHQCASYTYFDSAWALEPVCYLFEASLNAAAAGSHPDAFSGNSPTECQGLGGDCVYDSCCDGYSCFGRHIYPTCFESCPTEPPVPNAHWQGPCSPTPYTLCYLECDEGYSFQGTDRVLECDFGFWSMLGSLDARCVLLEPLPRNPGRS